MTPIPTGPVVLAPELYWRLRALVTEQALVTERRRAARAEAELAYEKAAATLLERGDRLSADIRTVLPWFDATAAWNLDDRTHTIEHLEPARDPQ